MKLEKIATSENKLSYFLREEFFISSSLINKLKYYDAFKVNDIPRHTDFIVKYGDKISAEIYDLEEAIFPSEKGNINLIYEDEALLVCDKESGMAVHPTHAKWTGTLANRVLNYYKETNQKCGIHIVTRLDRDTKGIVIFAKNAYVHSLLKNIDKTYLAWVIKTPEKESGIIDLPIERTEEMSLIRCIRPDGKRAITEYKIIEKKNDGSCLLELKAITGRTHQLRVHCSSQGWPIMGDPLYGGGSYIGGQRLVAYKITLNHPITKEKMTFTSHMLP